MCRAYRSALVVAVITASAAVAVGCGGGDQEAPAPEPRTPEAVAERVNALISAFVAKNYAAVCDQLAAEAVKGLIRAAAEEGVDADDCLGAATGLYEDIPEVSGSEVPEVAASDVTLEGRDSAVVNSPSPGGGGMKLVYEGGNWLALVPFFVR